MPKTIADIRFKIEQRVKDTIENQDALDWCNDAQSELTNVIEVPSTATIPVTTQAVAYTEPANIKRINRLWLQSERDKGYDRDLPVSYRRYNGQIIFERPFTQDDTLNVDFYKQLTYFTDSADEIDLDDRYETLYTSYGIAQYYDTPRALERYGEAQAKRQYEKHYGRHMVIRDQIAAQFTLQTQPSSFKEVYP